MPGLGTVLAAKVIGHVGDVSRFPTEHHFASYTGSAPMDASSGNNARHRLNTGGNRVPAQDRRPKDARGGPPSPETTAVQRGLPDHETRSTEPPRSGRLTHRGPTGEGWRGVDVG
ncbi:transposase [Streptomyces sp. NPDC007205]|uniref:transposase n=1 Tax=Streptomyces sp. NPDC007205 TaxID=3154316 RepID=UPI0033E334E8